MTKKLLALVLSVLMLVSLLPVSALAAVVVPATVSTVADLQDALDNPSFNPVSLGANIQIKTSDGLPDNMFKVSREVTLDLAGFNIDSICNSDYVISVDTDVLTLTNTADTVSTVSGQDYKIAPVGVASGAKLELDGALNISKVYLAENGKISKLGSTLNIASPITVISDSTTIPVEIIKNVNGYQKTTTDFVSAVAGEEVAVYGDTAYLAKPQTITFNANGGTFSDPDEETPETLVIPWHLGFDWPDWLTLAEQTALPTLTGYTFAGFKNKPASGGTTYTFFDKTGAMKITSPGTAPTLYADWTATEFKLAFYESEDAATPNKVSTGLYDITKTSNTEKTVSVTGKTFTGWKTESGVEFGYDKTSKKTTLDFTQEGVAADIVNDETYGTILKLYPMFDTNTVSLFLHVMTDTVSKDAAGERLRPTIIRYKERLYGSEFTLPDVSTLGYTLEGWYDKNDGGTLSEKLTSNTITVVNDENSLRNDYYSKWTPITYAVGFEDGEGTGGMKGQEIELTYGHKVSEDQATPLTPLPTRTGYVFNGYWSTAEDIEGATPGTQYFDKDGTAVDAYWLETDVDTLYARYAPTTFTIQLYKNDTMAGGASPTLMKDITYGSTVTLVDNPFTGFHAEFAGWNTKEAGDGDSYDDKASIDTSTLTPIKIGDAYYFRLYAQWDAEQVEVTFNLGYEATSVPEPKLVAYNTAIGELPTATRDGYDLVGWFTDPADSHSQYDETNVITDPVTLIAKWIGNPYTVTFHTNYPEDAGLENKVSPTFSNKTEDGATFPVFTYDALNFTAVPAEYTFLGWTVGTSSTPVYKAGDSQDLLVPEKNAAYDLYAQWTSGPIDIYLNANGGTIEGAIVYDSNGPKYEYYTGANEKEGGGAWNSGEEFTLPTPTKAGATFLGWYDDYECTEDAFLGVGGAKITVASGEEAGKNFIYAKWTKNIAVGIIPTANGTIADPEHALPGFDRTNESGNHIYKIGENIEVTLPVPEAATGYTFTGWKTGAGVEIPKDNLSFTIVPDTVGGGIALITAQYSQNLWTLTLDPQNGKDPTDFPNKEYGYTIDSVSAPDPKEGFTFLYWEDTKGNQYPEGSTFTMPDDDETLTAVWSGNDNTVIYKNLDGTYQATTTNPTTFNTEELPITLTDPVTTNAGLTFTEWRTTANDPNTKITEITTPGTQTIYATWAFNQFTLTYELDGGEMTGDTSVTKNYLTKITLPQPTKTGYGFGGWKLGEDTYAGGAEFKMPAENTTLTAQWTANEYEVTFNGNKPAESSATPVIDPAKKTVTYDAPYGDLATASLDGFTFAGWALDAEGKTLIDASTTVATASNHTVYATWTLVDTEKPNVTVAAPDPLTYGYSADEAPVLTAVITNEEDIYEYTYSWYTKSAEGTTEVGTDKTFKVPSGLDKGLDAGTTYYYCVVSAQLKGTTIDPLKSDEVSVPVVVDKAELTIVQWTTNSPAYNGKEQVVATLKVSPAVPQTSMHITVNGQDGTLIPNTDGSYSIKLRNAGNYTVTYKVDETANYYAKVPTGTGDPVSIAPQVLDITWKSTQADGSFNYPYAGGYPITGVEIELGNIQKDESDTPDTVNVTLSGNVETIPGNYTAKVSDPDNPNYVLPSIVEKPWNINYQTAEFQVKANDLTYNGSAQELVNATLVGCTIKYNEVGGTDGYYAQPITKTEEGTYTVYYELTASTYYQIIPESARYGSVEVTIAPKPIQLTWGTTELTYTGDPQAPTCDVTSGYKCGSDTINVTVTGQQTNVGQDYPASAAIDNHNYVIDPAFVETTFKIVPADIDKATVELTYTSAPYNGTVKTPGIKTITFNGHDLVADTDYTLEYKDNKEATTEAKVILTGTGNFTGTKTILFTITPRALTSIEEFEDVTYDGQDHKPATVKVYYTNAQTSEQVQVLPTDLYEVKWTDANNQTVDELKAPGTYTATITLTDAADSFTGSLTTTLTIKPITLAFDWNGPWALTYTGKPQDISEADRVEANNVLNGETVTLVFSGNTETNVGNYKFTITDIAGADKANYVLPELGKREMTWSITPADIATAVFTLSEDEFTYTGTVQGPTIATAKITLSGESVDIASSDYTFAWVDANGNVATPLNAGTYSLAVSAKDGGNFTGTVTTRPSFKIKPASLTLMAKDDTWTYGTSFEGHLKVTPVGLVNGETLKTSDVTYGYQITKGTTKYNVTDIPDVGEYGISIVNASSNNYDLTLNSGTLHVTQKELTVAEWTDTEVTFDGKAHAPTAVLEGIVNEDDVKAVVTTTNTNVKRDAAGNVIPYEGIEITLDGADKANYKMAADYTKGTLTILPRDIADANMSLVNDAPTYNGQNQYPEVAAPATIVLVPGEDPTTLVYNTDFTAGVDGESGSKDVGTTYNVKVTGKGNYTGERLLPFNVMPVTLTVNWSGDAFTYDSTEQAPTATLEGVLGVDNGKVVAIVEGKQINAGTDYTATVTLDGEAAGNYVLPTTGTEKTFSIVPATINTLEWSGLKHDYDGTVKEPTITVAEGQTFGEDVVNVWYAMTSDGKQVPVKDDVYQSIDAGDYEVTPVALSNPNYVLGDTAKAPKTMTIKPIEIMISWGEETEFIYDGEPHNATVNVYTVGGDAIPYTLTEDQINAGKYTAKVSFETSKNYTYDEADTTKAFTIAKAEPTLTVTMEGWTYKQTEKEPVVTGNEGEGTVTFEYFKNGTSIGATKPLTAGTYTVKASVAETANYTAKTSEAASFTIEKASVAMTVSITGWTAGQTANKPTTNLAGELDDSMVTFTYAPAGTTTYSATVPSTSGNYTVKANFPGNDNFLPAEATASFTIASSGGGGGGGFVPSGGGSSSGGGGGAGYKLTLAATTNGTIGFEVPTGLKGRSTANGEISETIDRGTGITLVVKPADNYEVDKVSYKNANVSGDFTVEADGSIYFNMFNAATTVTATFKPKNDNDPSVGRLTISKYTNGYLTCSKGYGCLLNQFTDLDPTAWYHDGIHYCLENGIMQGFGTDEFLPFDVTTRAQVVTVLWNIAGHPIANNGTVFSDVKFTDWYYDAVMWAAANGIVDGYGDGKFGPNDKITHEQIAKIFYGYAKFYGYDVSDYMDISNLPGANKVSAWAVPYVSWAVAAGLCCGKDGDLSVIAAPEFATRAELAATILNFCTRIAIKPAAKQ